MRRFGYVAKVEYSPARGTFKYKVRFVKDGEEVREPSGEIFMTRFMATWYAKRWLRRLNKGLAPKQEWEIR